VTRAGGRRAAALRVRARADRRLARPNSPLRAPRRAVTTLTAAHLFVTAVSLDGATKCLRLFDAKSLEMKCGAARGAPWGAAHTLMHAWHRARVRHVVTSLLTRLRARAPPPGRACSLRW
jgi:hypothetical protein